MTWKANRKTKAATLITLTVLTVLILNLVFERIVGKWSLLAAVGAAMFILWPVLHHFLKRTVYGKILYKIDSKKGLNLIDRIGAGHPRFWTFIGDLAIIISFGGLGAAFVTNHRNKRDRSLIIAILVFLAVFVYLSQSYIMLFPFGVAISTSLFALFMAAVMSYVAYGLSYFLSSNRASTATFLLALLFFGSPYFLDFSITGSYYSVAMGVSLGIIGLPAIVIMPLLIQGINIAAGLSTTPGLNPGYPEMENGMPVLKYAGTNISIPFFPDILIAFIIMIALHECFHGLVARSQGIRLKHTGLIFLSIIPMGAFVEPDEEQFKKEKTHKQMRVYAAGSFANMFVVAFGCFLIGNLMLSIGSVEADGFIVGGVVKDSAAYGLLEPGDVVKSAGGEPTPTFWDFSMTMKGRRPGENLTIVTQNRTISLTLGQSPNNESRGFVGLEMYNDPIHSIYAPSVMTSHIEASSAASVFSLIKWIFFLNLMLGIMNLLPLRFFDGGYSYNGLFLWLEGKLPHGRKLSLAKNFSNGFGLLVIAVFILNLSPYFF